LFEVRYLFFQTHVHFHGSGNGANRSGTHAEFPDRFDGCAL
jgi:hypothetical protein